jgi:FkbM family methyltransferase
VYGHELAKRIAMTISCEDSLKIPKVSNAGKVFTQGAQEYQLMHNGVKVLKDGYCGPWMTEIITQLQGHHEPQEELVFHLLLDRIRNDETTSKAPVMIEIGSYWAYYSLWFLDVIPEGRAICIEPDPDNLQIGVTNFELNGRSGEFIQGVVGSLEGKSIKFPKQANGEIIDVNCLDFFKQLEERKVENVDIVHLDIQGGETDFLQQLEKRKNDLRISYLVVSTHDYSISGSAITHQECIKKIIELGGYIVAEHSIPESFSGDGLILASFLKSDEQWKIQVSHNRSLNSLFGELEERLQCWIVEVEEHKTVISNLDSELSRLRGIIQNNGNDCERHSEQQRQISELQKTLQAIYATRIWRATRVYRFLANQVKKHILKIKI